MGLRRGATVPMLPGNEHVGCLSVERIRDFEGVVSYSRHVHMTPRPGLKPRGYSRLTGSNGGTQSCRYHVENPARKSRITTLLGLILDTVEGGENRNQGDGPSCQHTKARSART